MEKIQAPVIPIYDAKVVVAQPYNATYNGGNNGVELNNNVEARGVWNINVCESGNFLVCLYSFCCGRCALGEIKTGLDGSNSCIGCCCFSVPAMRFLVRTAYNIEGNAHWDCWVGLCCPCCAVNQMLQTVRARGRPDIPQVGSEFHVNPRTGFQQRSCCYTCYDAIYALCCHPCSQGLTLQTAGVPWWFGCLCFNAFAANNVLSHHNRSKTLCGNECVTDCCIPCVFVAANQMTYGASDPIISWFYTFTNLVEENNRHHRTCCYGLNCIRCLVDFFNWLFCCHCNQEEGRYLVRSTPIVY